MGLFPAHQKWRNLWIKVTFSDIKTIFDFVCILYSQYFVLFSDVDRYGFERGEDFDYESYEEFMSEYLAVLTRRLVKWEKLLKSEDRVNRSRKGIATPMLTL